MKNMFKIKYLAIVVAAWLPMVAMAAMAADGLPPGGMDSKAATPDERKARMAQCKADPEKCRAEKRARAEQWCNDNPARCKEMRDRREQRLAECKADPEKCRTEKRARFDDMCNANPERCKDMKEKMDKRRADKQAKFDERFRLADSDGNGLISRDEAQKNLPHLAHHFDRVDANRDGQISREEIVALRKARFERRARRGDTRI